MKNLANSLRPRLTYANVISTLALFLVLAGGTALATGLRKNSVNSLSVKNNSLLSADLRNGKAVTGADVADGSLAGADVADGSLGGGEVANGSITGADVADGSLGGEELGKATVALANIAANAVNSAAILDGSITGADIGADTLTGVQVDESTLVVPTAQRLDGRRPGEFLSAHVYEVESATETGQPQGDGTFRIFGLCNPGDRVLSGGPTGVASKTAVLESFANQNRWIVRINPHGATDNFQVRVVCAQQSLLPK